MKRLWITLGIAFGAVVAVLAVLRMFLAPDWFRPVAGESWQAELPRMALAPHRRADAGWDWVEAEGAASYRIGVRPLAGTPRESVDAAAAEMHPQAVERVDVPEVDGVFLLSGSRKQWRATLLFPAGGRLFAADVEEARGNAAEPLMAVSRIASSLEIGMAAPPFVAPSSGDLDARVRPAVERHLVGMESVLPVILPILLLGFAFTIGVMKLAGRVPLRAPGAAAPILDEPDVSLVIRRGRWQVRQTVGALVLDRDGLHVFTMGREIATVPAADLGTISRDPGTRPNRPFVVQADGRVIRFRPGDAGRWERVLGRAPSGAWEAPYFRS